MEKWLCFLVCFLAASARGGAGLPAIDIPAVIMKTPGSMCPAEETLETARSLLSERVVELITMNEEFALICGGPSWRRVAFMNMSEANSTCPEQWRLYEEDSINACGRRESLVGTCDAIFYPSRGYMYREVCGRIRGYQFASPDTSGGPSNHLDPGQDLNGPYLDGVSITRGSPREHIWSFFAGWHSGYCCHDGHSNVLERRTFVGNNTFCDVGNPNGENFVGRLFTDHPLWDGTTACHASPSCCTPHPGPWFYASLPQLSLDDIEVRICGDQETEDEDTPIALLEIYVK